MFELDHYQILADAFFSTFEFISEGPRGRIRKVVQFTETETAGIYNLGFGDAELDTNEIDDLVISNNGDSEKVLATVVATVYAFTKHNPSAMVFATGSTRPRTRLYRIGISNNLAEALVDFEILGMRNGRWETFEKNTDYEAFLVRRR